MNKISDNDIFNHMMKWGHFQLKKVVTILTGILFLFTLQSPALAEDRAAAATFEMSAEMKDTLAVVIIFVVMILSWILAKYYHLRRFNPSGSDSSKIKTEKSSTHLNQEVKKQPIQEVPSVIPSPSVEQPNAVTKIKPEPVRNGSEVKPTQLSQQRPAKRFNVFTIVAFVLILVSAFVRGSNREK
ncbi:hypothetical protein ACLIBG_13715 [Virgibacillus sp. W0181]|uniref:hypothetical protein n=1 Tax=Virgibacillus sp. W0181 TaxID=3391581 RepID=UPI003F4642F7